MHSFERPFIRDIKVKVLDGTHTGIFKTKARHFEYRAFKYTYILYSMLVNRFLLFFSLLGQHCFRHDVPECGLHLIFKS